MSDKAGQKPGGIDGIGKFNGNPMDVRKTKTNVDDAKNRKPVTRNDGK